MRIAYASNGQSERIYTKLDFLFEHYNDKFFGSVKVNQAIADALSKHVGKSYGYTYIVSIRNRTFPLTRNIIKAIEAEYKRINGYVPRKRYRLKIEAQSEEQFKAWTNVPMEERAKALDELAGYKGEK